MRDLGSLREAELKDLYHDTAEALQIEEHLAVTAEFARRYGSENRRSRPLIGEQVSQTS